MATNFFPNGNTNDVIVAWVLSAQSVTDGVVAKVGGGQSTATALTSAFNRVVTVATAADSVALPLAQAGLTVDIFNTSANSLQVFGAGTDTIASVATATGVAQAGTKHAKYVCTKSAPAGNWERILSA